jgi:hypothetical protein
MSALKTASYRVTHPGAPPFLEAQSVLADSYKTVTDAWQGFHMIPLYADSREFTDFVTEWGMLRYKRMPMGDHAWGTMASSSALRSSSLAAKRWPGPASQLVQILSNPSQSTQRLSHLNPGTRLRTLTTRSRRPRR